MADVSLIKGGTPVIKYMWCENDYNQFEPPFGNAHIPLTPPYDAHVDGAYGSGAAYFTLGMPVRPNLVGMDWQRKAFADKNPQVDDFIDLLVIPEDHFVTAINFKIVESDARMAGATVALSARTVQLNAAGEFVYTEIPDVEDAVAAQAVNSPIPVDKPYNAFVSLVKADGGYAVPLYAAPSLPAADEASSPVFGKTLVLGVKVVSLPTDNKVSFQHMMNGWYLSAKVQGFECPTHY